MRITVFEKTIERTYKNNGIHAQQVAEYNLLGTVSKHDNKPFWAGGDIGDLQVKSCGATVCHGLDIRAHIELDAATCYGYVFDEFKKMLVMNPDEWAEFVDEFGYETRESSKKGGAAKLRVRCSDKRVEMWVKAKA